MNFPPGPNSIVPTPPAGDSSNRSADTEFVTLAVALVSAAIPTIPPIPSAATQADQEAASSTAVFTSPGRQQYHPSAAKFFVSWSTVTINPPAYNVSSVTNPATGDYVITFTNALSTSNYAVSGIIKVSANGGETGLRGVMIRSITAAQTSSSIEILTSTNAGTENENTVHLQGFGDLP